MTVQRETGDAAAIAEVVKRYVREGPTLDNAFADSPLGPLTLYSTPELTVQRIEWPAGFRGAPHDHRMWAVVGVYVGAEHNQFHRRGDHGLEDAGGRVLEQGDVLVLGDEAIHSVANPSRGSVIGLHVYGGDIDGIARSQWRPDGTEGPLAEVRAEYLTMWAAMHEYLSECSPSISDAAVFDGLAAINEQVGQRQRILTRDEVRQILAELRTLGTEP